MIPLPLKDDFQPQKLGQDIHPKKTSDVCAKCKMHTLETLILYATDHWLRGSQKVKSGKNLVKK